MAGYYGYGYPAPVNTQQAGITGGVAGLVSDLLVARDPKVRNQGVIARIDKIGDFCNQLKTTINDSVTAGQLTTPITWSDYDPKSFTN